MSARERSLRTLPRSRTMSCESKNEQVKRVANRCYVITDRSSEVHERGKDAEHSDIFEEERVLITRAARCSRYAMPATRRRHTYH